jgi:LPXTG-site transpeptidase (sortase) family protein
MPTPQDSAPAGGPTPDKDLAAEIIRKKIEQLYAKEQKEQQTTEHPETVHHGSQHQQFIHNLTSSGKSLEEIQTAWHAYYLQLPDDQKKQVWQEFYQTHARNRQAATDKAIAEASKDNSKLHHHKVSTRNVGQIKKQLLGQVNGQGQGKGKLQTKQHLQALLFGLGVGSIVVILLLFSFFNERIIAPFIQPSRTVTNTPIISGDSEAIGPNPEVIIPKINVEIPVVYTQPSVAESAIENSLEDGVVHYATTPLPGQVGNAVIFGHSSNNILNKGKYKFAFVLLNRLEVGDTFILTKDGKRFVYRVYDRKIVKPTEVGVLGNTAKPATATLITCDPPGTSINRLVVIGEQISPNASANTASTATAPSNQPAVIPSNSVSLWSRIYGWLSR